MVSDLVRSRAARDLAERALVRLVHSYGSVPELVLLGGLFRISSVAAPRGATLALRTWTYGLIWRFKAGR